MNKKLIGSIIISRASGGPLDDTPVHITIQDQISGCRVLDIYMALDEYAKATLASHGQCFIEHYQNHQLIGMKVETKAEIVPFDSSDKDAAIDAALKPFEVDGWKARRSDMTNWHCRVPGKGAQRVLFSRHVDPATGKPVL